jgi:hypothetical protein
MSFYISPHTPVQEPSEGTENISGRKWSSENNFKGKVGPALN